jgi:hypothetical protein
MTSLRTHAACSNASSGAIIGQIFVRVTTTCRMSTQAEKNSQVGLICDRLGRKTALVATTLLIILGATLGMCLHIDLFYNIG